MPARKNSRRKTRTKREALVHSHMERVSRDLLEKHPDVVRNFIGRNFGIYALYKKNRLYYVGLATGLAWRLRSHKRNRHGNQWDRFSIYLVIKDRHLKEIESLILQIARPKGNKVGGKPIGSKDMRRRIAAAIRQKQRHAISSLFEAPRGQTKAVGKKEKLETKELTKLLPAGARLRATLHGKVFRARARRDGQVRYNGKVFPSLSAAGGAARKRPTNGWWFWRIERGKGNWVRLTEIRKAGTPVYPR